MTTLTRNTDILRAESSAHIARAAAYAADAAHADAAASAAA